MPPDPDTQALFEGVLAHPASAAHKMALADRLYELGQSRLAYGFHWAAVRGYHPRTVKQSGVVAWAPADHHKLKPKDLPARLPRPVANSLQVRRRPGWTQPTAWLSFEMLGDALESLGEAIGIPQQRSEAT